MLFDEIPADATTPDPIASPELVPSENIIRVGRDTAGGDNPGRVFVLTQLPVTAAISFEYYIEIEKTSEPQLSEKVPMADREWRLAFSNTAIPGGQAQETTQPLAPGNYYFRITVAAATGSKLLVGVI